MWLPAAESYRVEKAACLRRTAVATADAGATAAAESDRGAGSLPVPAD